MFSTKWKLLWKLMSIFFFRHNVPKSLKVVAFEKWTFSGFLWRETDFCFLVSLIIWSWPIMLSYAWSPNCGRCYLSQPYRSELQYTHHVQKCYGDFKLFFFPGWNDYTAMSLKTNLGAQVWIYSWFSLIHSKLHIYVKAEIYTYIPTSIWLNVPKQVTSRCFL